MGSVDRRPTGDAHSPDRARGIPDWLLERYAAGELPEPERSELRRALDADPAEGARLEALRKDDQAALSAHPPERVVREVKRRLRAQEMTTKVRQSARPRWIALPAVAMAATAAIALFALRPDAEPGGASPPATLAEGVRLKGASSTLHVFRIRGQRQERLGDGAAAAPGDRLQLHYLSGGKRFGVIVSLDGAGGATLHLPENPRGSCEIPENGSPPHGYELDAAPGFERFFLVTSDAPLSADAVLAAARALAHGPDPRRAPLALAAGTEQVSLLLTKGTR